MEELLYNLIAHINEGLPELSLVDEDYGQLEALDDPNIDQYPLTYPAVLIDAAETEWSDITGLSQKGKATVRLRLIIDCYDDTHEPSGTMGAIMQRAEMLGNLHRLVQGFRPMDDGVMRREKSRFYTWKHGIKVYENVYTLTVTENIQETEKADAPKKIVLSVGRL